MAEMANPTPQNTIARGMAHVVHDFDYMFTDMVDLNSFINWFQQQKEAARHRNRQLVTVAILGHRELAHGYAEMDISRELALCMMAKYTQCHHRRQPILLIFNISSPRNSWEVFRQEGLVERLHHLEVDLLLLAPGQVSLESQLRGATTREAVIRWRRELRKTVLALQEAVMPRRGAFLSNLPAILVVLPNKGKQYSPKLKYHLNEIKINTKSIFFSNGIFPLDAGNSVQTCLKSQL